MAHRLAADAGFTAYQVDAGIFKIQSFARITAPGEAAQVYIEGDGHAWRSRTSPSLDPTPFSPLALQLAVRDPAANVIYLARPCQYAGGACARKYWTSARLSAEVIEALGGALSFFKAKDDIGDIHLVGFSGGGGAAVLLAAQRKDISSIRTVAGNLDTDVFARAHNVTPLYESINPAHAARTVAHIPQVHFVGQKDEVITPEISASFVRAAKQSYCIVVERVDGADHNTGWQEKWPTLLARQPRCRTQSE